MIRRPLTIAALTLERCCRRPMNSHRPCALADMFIIFAEVTRCPLFNRNRFWRR